MRLARKCLIALCAVAVGACGEQAPSGPIGSSQAAPQGTPNAGLEAVKVGLAGLAVPTAEGTDLLRDRLAAAFDLSGALGDQADVILGLVADADRSAYAQLPAVAPPTSRADPVVDAVPAAYFPGIPVPPGAPPPTTELMLALPGALDSVGRA